jgi:hypothetical protein
LSGVARDAAALEDPLEAGGGSAAAVAIGVGETGAAGALALGLALVIELGFGAAGDALAEEVARPMKASAKSPHAKKATRTIGFHQVVWTRRTRAARTSCAALRSPSFMLARQLRKEARG